MKKKKLLTHSTVLNTWLPNVNTTNQLANKIKFCQNGIERIVIAIKSRTK